MIDKHLKNKIYAVLLVVLLGFFGVHLLYVLFVSPERGRGFNDIAYVHFIDVGQGDATLIQAEDFNVLIDAGENSSEVLAYLTAVQIDRLDYVVATHPHADHIGGMADVLMNWEVRNFIMPDVVHTTGAFESMLFALGKSDANVISAEPGYVFGSDDIQLTILGPIRQDYENLNDYSVVIKMQAGDTEFLFAGDVEMIAEKDLLRGVYDLSADVYKVSHHGSDTSSHEDFIDAVRPKLAIISCGKNNSYGHPHREVLETLSNYGVQILRTDKNGTIIVYTDGKDVSYGSER